MRHHVDRTRGRHRRPGRQPAPRRGRRTGPRRRRAGRDHRVPRAVARGRLRRTGGPPAGADPMTDIATRAASVAGPRELRPSRQNAMRAVIYRELLLLTRNRTNLLLAILPTTIYLLLFSTSLNGLVGQVRYHGVLVGYPEFTIPAIMLSSMLAASTTTGTSLFQEETGGMAVELWSYPLSRPAYISGKIIATTLLVLVQSVAALLLGVLVFHVGWPASHWVALALGTMVASLAFNAFFLMLASFVHDFQRFMVLINVIGPMLLFS